MQQGLLPLFPLEVVLFPGGELPLHIFEPRYKEMIGEARRDGSEFGIVLASENGLVQTGCTAVITRVMREYSDGRLDILTVGKRRFEILLVNEERSFLRGAVEYFGDEEDDSPASPDSQGLREIAIAAYDALRSLNDDPPLEPASAADPLLSFRLAQVVKDLAFRQSILTLRRESERIARLAEFLPGWATSQLRVHNIKTVAPSNGHGHRKVPGQ
jgi:Lon protease-like protein